MPTPHNLAALTRSVPMGFPAAIQAVAALEDRLLRLQSDPHPEAWAIADTHAALAAVREAFGLWPRADREAVEDAAHEARYADTDDVPLALHIYQSEGR